MDRASALAAAMEATALGGGGLALFLVKKAQQAPGAKQLAAFLCLVGLWACGLLMPDWRGEALMATAPLGGVVFLHFVTRLGAMRLQQNGLCWFYALAMITTLVSMQAGSGHFLPSGVFRYDQMGYLAVAVTLLMAAVGHRLLFHAWRRIGGRRRRQLGVVMASSGLGLISVSSLGLPLLGWDGFPWPLLLLPLYLPVLVYGVLRYELMALNEWVRRGLSWGLLMGLTLLVTALPAGLLAAEGGPWLAMLAVTLAMLAWPPLRRLVDRLVYLGGEVTAEELATWRAAFAEAEDEAAIDALAGDFLQIKLRVSERDRLQAPPGPSRVIEIIDGLISEAKLALDQRRAYAERKRLAELGALAATIAHDLRNPMNIIAMAIAEAGPALRGEVKIQLARMEALVRDLLDYAKPWRIEPVEVDLLDVMAGLVPGREVKQEIPAGFVLHADPLRLAQALGNLLANARAGGGRVLVAADRDGGTDNIHVCDNGPGIAEDIRASLFEPFVSRSPDGTGLGLAVVAKVMAAHGGSVSLEDYPGWTTCFTLRFPA